MPSTVLGLDNQDALITLMINPPTEGQCISLANNLMISILYFSHLPNMHVYTHKPIHFRYDNFMRAESSHHVEQSLNSCLHVASSSLQRLDVH